MSPHSALRGGHDGVAILSRWLRSRGPRRPTLGMGNILPNTKCEEGGWATSPPEGGWPIPTPPLIPEPIPDAHPQSSQPRDFFSFHFLFPNTWAPLGVGWVSHLAFLTTRGIFCYFFLSKISRRKSCVKLHFFASPGWVALLRVPVRAERPTGGPLDPSTGPQPHHHRSSIPTFITVHTTTCMYVFVHFDRNPDEFFFQ